MDINGEVYLNGPNGEVIECDILLTHEENGHKYVVYTDKTVYNNQILRTYVSEFVETGEENPKLLEVEDMDLLRRIQDRINNEVTPELLEEKRKLSEENDVS